MNKIKNEQNKKIVKSKLKIKEQKSKIKKII
jgi:hypothetical protein